MTDTDITSEQVPVPPTARQLASARAFVTAHGKPAKAVVQRIGSAGARVVLIGADGALGDVLVPDVDTGNALVEAIQELEPATWDAETMGALDIGPAHRRRMAGSFTRR